MAPNTSLPLPPFFDPDRVGEVRRIPYQELHSKARTWAGEHGLTRANEDTLRVGLLLIDCQNTFCTPDFELYVGGRSGNAAVQDSRRICEFIYRNLGRITRIIATMDTHEAYQIFHAAFWIDETGAHPAPLSTITLDDVQSGRWKPDPAMIHIIGDWDTPEHLSEYAEHYVRELKEQSKYDLTVWPYHAMLGGIGHALDSSIEEAVFVHAMARYTRSGGFMKGYNLLSEAYSALRPEVQRDQSGRPIADPNDDLINGLLGFDRVIVGGQAKSHCLAWTVDDFLTYLKEHAPEKIATVYLLEDCTSPVVVPDVADFTEQADEAFRRFAEAGMHVVDSSTSVEDWPGFA